MATATEAANVAAGVLFVLGARPPVSLERWASKRAASSPHQMLGIRVTITHFVDDSQPGWVEFHFLDANGHKITFYDKVPVVTSERLDANSLYPRTGVVACEIRESQTTPSGERLLVVNTGSPWGVVSIDDENIFTVKEDEIFEL
jgi:hypothetical protein